MTTANKTIKINDVEAAKKLVCAAVRCPFDIDIVSKGKIFIDAKSILGVLSLDVEEPLELKYTNLLYIYVIIINVVTFFIYGLDKSRAKAGQWRIPEAQLIFLAVIGGSVGALAGMKVFHHKTRKPKFKTGVPAILIIQLIIYFLFL